MKIYSEEIPQADNLDDVIKTVQCVAQGGQTYQDIARAIDKVERQGRYYRKAAEILGLIKSTGTNHSVLTHLGKQFIESEQTTSNSILINSVFNARIFQRLIPFLESHKEEGVTRKEIIEFILQASEISGDTMAPRRLSSVVSWLETLEIIQIWNNRYYLSATNINQKINILEFTDIEEPILPKSNDLQEYEIVNMRVAKAREDIIIYQNAAAIDRADNAHRRLVNLVSQRIKNAGSIPRFNKVIDLAAKHDDQDYIFEMKSVTESNAKSQIRSGLSQLYEYRYLQNLPDAKLILVIEKQLPQNHLWMIDYLETDRDVSLVWDGDNNLFGNKKTREKLNFLNVQ